MKFIGNVLRAAAFAAGLMLGAGGAFAQAAPARIAGADCVTPPILHCPDTECQGIMVINPGPTVEPKTRRTFFLDCPADYKPGDKVTLVLSLHGGGSYANWQRNYFPLMDFKDKYHLVIATPSSPYRVWNEGDDAYLQNIVDEMVAAVGKENVKAFWLVGHSQGGMTSSRIICTPYFKDKVDVRISLSGGRVGSPPRPMPAGFKPPPGMAALFAEPKCDFSFIFSQGENEAKAQGGLPATSTWADKYGCGARVQLPDVVDTKQGYVWDSSRQNPGSDMWGRYPKPGTAQVYQFPNCKGGMVVADVLKLKKGHTEGYEPNVTEEIIKLAASAPGGKIANGKWNPPKPPPAPAPFGIPGARPGGAPRGFPPN
jgi:pimeloyl-ACP methyl ester carboxylesterase